MPLFKRREKKPEPGEQSAAPRVLSQQDIFDRLDEEIFRAERYGRSLVVLCVRPQRIAGEASIPAEMTLAAAAVSAQLRFSDRVGALDEGALVVVLPETPTEVARVISHRIVTDLAIRAGGATHIKWLVGTSTFPDDGTDPPALVSAALQRDQG